MFCAIKENMFKFSQVNFSRKKKVQLIIAVLVIFLLAAVFRKQILQIFASDLSNSRSTWCAYDYADDQTASWWADVKNYYTYTPTEDVSYSWDLSPIRNWSGKIDVSKTFGLNGILVNRGVSFTGSPSGPPNFVWLYSFSGEPMNLKIFGITTNSNSRGLGPAYGYNLYYKGEKISKVNNIFMNPLGDYPVQDPAPSVNLTIEATRGAGAYMLQFNQNFATARFKPMPGYPMSFGFIADRTYPFFDSSVIPHFYVPNKNTNGQTVSKIIADIKVLDSNDDFNDKLFDPNGVQFGIEAVNGKIDVSDEYAAHTGGGLMVKTGSPTYDFKPGVWKIDVTEKSSYVRQLFFHNIPNITSNEQQFLMVPRELINTDNAICVQSEPFAIDKVLVENADNADFNGTYEEVLFGPDVPTDLMPSTSNYVNWRPGWAGRKNEIAIYQKPSTEKYIVKTISNPFADSKGYYLIFDAGATNPASIWYRFKATSTDARWLSNDAPLQTNWQKATDTWSNTDSTNGWTNIATMKVTSVSSPVTATCP